MARFFTATSTTATSTFPYLTSTQIAVTGLSAGSIPFIGSGGILSQNNANLFWDNTNYRLGIGTTTPSAKLEVAGDTNITGDLSITDTLTVNGNATITKQPLSPLLHTMRSSGDLVPVNGFGIYDISQIVSVVTSNDTTDKDYLIDCNPYRIGQNGDIEAVNIPINDVTDITSIKIRIWRPTSKNELYNRRVVAGSGLGTMYLVGESETISQASLANGNNYRVLTQKIKGARIGDFVGFYLDREGSGADTFDAIEMGTGECNLDRTASGAATDAGFDWFDDNVANDGTSQIPPIMIYMKAPVMIFYGDSQTAGGNETSAINIGNFTCADTDICTLNSHGLTNGDAVYLTTTTTLPAPLATFTKYYIITANTNTFLLSTTRGGSAVNITDTGTGTHTLNQDDVGNHGLNQISALFPCNTVSSVAGCNENLDSTFPWIFAELANGISYQNLGIGGKTISQLSAWTNQIIARKPRMVVMLFGANDVSPTSVSSFSATLTTMVSDFTNAGIATAIIKVLPSNALIQAADINTHVRGVKLELFNKEIDSIAKTYNSIVIDASTYVGINFSANLQAYGTYNVASYEPMVPLTGGDNGFYYFNNQTSPTSCSTSGATEPTWCKTVGCTMTLAGAAPCTLENGGSQELLWNSNPSLIPVAASFHFNKEGNALIAQAVYDTLKARATNLLDTKEQVSSPFSQWSATNFDAHIGSISSKPHRPPFFHVNKADQTVNNATAKITWDAYNAAYNRYGYYSNYEGVFDLTNDAFQSKIAGVYTFTLHVTVTPPTINDNFDIFIYKGETVSDDDCSAIAGGGTGGQILSRAYSVVTEATSSQTLAITAMTYLDGVDDVVYACFRNPQATAIVLDGTDSNSYFIGYRIGD